MLSRGGKDKAHCRSSVVRRHLANQGRPHDIPIPIDSDQREAIGFL
jgi:hypothetical protein